MPRKKNGMQAFKEVTLTKLLALFFSVLFAAVVTISIIFKFKNPDIDILNELQVTATLAGAYLTGYLGKSGYEYYSRTRYTTMDLQRYGPGSGGGLTSYDENGPYDNGGLQI